MSHAHITQCTNLFSKQNRAPKTVLRAEIPIGPPSGIRERTRLLLHARSVSLCSIVKLHFGSSEAGLSLKSVGLS